MIVRFIIAILFLILPCSIKAERIVVNFNKGWEFVKDIDTSIGALQLSKGRGSIQWEKVSLPHTANIEPFVTVNKQWQGTCYYRKFFSLQGNYNGKGITIRFEGAMHEAWVYLNGNFIAHHVGGYLPFEVDLLENVKFNEENCLLVKLNNEDNPVIPPGKPLKELDFNYYGGLYRDVLLTIKDNLFITDAVSENKEAGGGVMVWYENVSNKSADILIKSEIKNSFQEAKQFDIQYRLTDKNGHVISGSNAKSYPIASGLVQSVVERISINNPLLWSPDEPNLYKLEIKLISDNYVFDNLEEHIGVRSISITSKDGLVINEKKVLIRGTNRHQEYPYIGYALSDNAQYRDAYKIKDAGFNFIRCSHYPPSPSFLKACDELGILVMNSIPGWQFFGNDLFYQNSIQNIRDMIHRDRNHPSIILWEASLNETEMDKAYMQKAHNIVHSELPYSGVYTCGWIDDVYDVFIPARQHSKAPDYWKKYDKNKPILIAEYGDWEYYAQNAGFNQTEFKDLKSDERSSRQLRGFGQRRLAQQALNYQESHNDNLYGNLIGDANWLMFDYNRGYAPDIESSGIMDIFRLPKFTFYFYQSQKDVILNSAAGFNKPMIYIANYWNDSANNFVTVYSNCNEVELLLNDKLVGKKNAQADHHSENLLHPTFTFKDVKYEKGKLVAIGFIEGKKVAETYVVTPGEATQLKLRTDISGKPLQAGYNDVIFIYADVLDALGNIVLGASEKLQFSIKGNAQLIGDNPVNAEAGIASILLKAGEKKGKIKIKVKGKKLKTTTLDLQIEE